jgi:tetraacyldisaccharide 4'-kinase
MLPETPKFWRERGLLAHLLLPFSWLYNAGHCLKTALAKPYTASIPVICVGGVVAGGSGKTPVVHALVKIAREEMGFVNPVILTRGYGGVVRGPSLVDVQAHNFMDVGDEALLHAVHAPTIVSKDRAAGLRLAEAMGADLVVMDDGLQNSSVAKTISFAVVDAQYKFGNGYTLPAGPLREPVDCAMRKIDAVILTNGDTDIPHETIFRTSLSVLSEHDMSRTYTAFAGLGHPEKFRVTLEQNGFKIGVFKSFPDHYPYTPEEITGLIEQAGTNALITTQKDLVRIPGDFWHAIHALAIGLTFESSTAVCNLVRARLGR